MVRYSDGTVIAAILESGALPACLDLMFEYKWNNFLHSEVEDMFSLLLAGARTQLMRCLRCCAAVVARSVRARLCAQTMCWRSPRLSRSRPLPRP